MAVTQVDAIVLAPVGAMLGEGPVWIADAAGGGRLWFVDIKAPAIYRVDPATGQHDRWDAPEETGWVLPTDDPARLLVGMASGLYLFSPADGGFTPYRAVEPDRPGNRLNDAAADPAGRLWFGSMDKDECDATGRVYRHDAGVVRDSGVTPVVITNGPAISADGRTLYAVDTLGRTVDAYTIDGDGRLGDRRRFLSVDPKLGHPDGATCDAESGVWIGFWGGWAARRFAPDGAMTHEVRFPAANVTKVAIGGPDGRTAYATTARKGLDAAALAAQPSAGDVFTFPVDVPGAAMTPIRLGR